MLGTLAVLTPGNVRKQALNALGDPDAKLRAAGARAFARPGGGRPTLYRLQPLLADASADVRAEAAAGMVRACGDLANDYLLPLFKARDVQPLAAMAPELGKASSPASADLLAKIQKRPEAELKLPVLAALANRQDAAGKALYEPLAQAVKKDPYASPEARRIVYGRASADELKAMALKDPAFGPLAYKAAAPRSAPPGGARLAGGQLRSHLPGDDGRRDGRLARDAAGFGAGAEARGQVVVQAGGTRAHPPSGRTGIRG